MSDANLEASRYTLKALTASEFLAECGAPETDEDAAIFATLAMRHAGELRDFEGWAAALDLVTAEAYGEELCEAFGS